MVRPCMLCLLLGALLAQCQGQGEQFPGQGLYARLFNASQYQRLARPFTPTNFTTQVKVHLTLLSVTDVNEDAGYMEANFLVWMTWLDPRLTWSPEQHHGQTTVSVPTKFIWTPDVILYNNAEEVFAYSADVPANLLSDGTVSLVRPAKLRSACDLDLTDFPLDRHTCQLQFLSWTYDQRALNLSFRYPGNGIDTSQMVASTGWVLERSRGRVAVAGEADPCPGLCYSLTVRRACHYCRLLFTLPLVLLQLLVPVQFLLPIDSRERASLCGLLLVGTLVMGHLLGDVLPSRKAVLPRLGVYHFLTFLWATMALLFSVLNLHVCDSWRHREHVPALLRQVFMGRVASLVCVKTPRDLTETKGSKPVPEVAVEPACSEAGKGETTGDEHQRQVVQLLTSLVSEVHRQRTLHQQLEEWRLLSVVFDRILFFVFLLAVLVSLVVWL